MSNATARRLQGLQELDQDKKQDQRTHRNGHYEPEQYLAVGKPQAVGHQHPVDGTRSADAGNHGICHEQGVEQAAADTAEEVVLQKETRAPALFKLRAEHPQHEHVYAQVPRSPVQELVAAKPPDLTPQHIRAHQREVLKKEVTGGADLHDVDQHVGDHEALYRRRDGPARPYPHA